MERKEVLARTQEAFGGRRSVHDSLILPQHNHVEYRHSDIQDVINHLKTTTLSMVILKACFFCQ